VKNNPKPKMNKQLIRISLMIAALMILLSGCATNHDTPPGAGPSASPTVSGNVSVGADKRF
jgi:uncharacterized lipoprotein YajG